MTFSICVREEYKRDGEDHRRFGAAATTRMPGTGGLIPFASEDGAVAVQSFTTGDLGPRVLDYLADGLAVEDAVSALLDADAHADKRQVHAVGRGGTFVFSPNSLPDWFGHEEGANYTVAGNVLAGEKVLEATARTYRESDRDSRLATRLIDALEAGYEVGGDRREDMEIQSAALVVADTGEPLGQSYYNDLRADATREPINDLRERHRLGAKGYEICAEKYDW